MAIVLDNLQILLNEIRKQHYGIPIVISGDFNAHVANLGNIEKFLVANTTLLPSRCSLDESFDSHGEYLLDFLKLNGMFMLNGRSPSDTHGSHTYFGSGYSTIDFICIELVNIDAVVDSEVNIVPTLSDHYPITGKFSFFPQT